MTRPALLLIAYHFPPDNAIGGARPFRFYKYLKRLGYDCHVVTAAHGESLGVTTDIEYVPDPLRTNPREGLPFQMERVGKKLFLRAELVLGWSSAAWRAGRSFLDRTKAETVTILSSAPPVGTHLAAWRLARYSGRPWIADFRDPIDSPTGEKAVFQGAAGPRLERSILKAASVVLANTDSMLDAWAVRYPDLREKIHVLWNGFDPEDEIHPQPLPERDCMVLSHVGELYGGRDIRPVLYAVEHLLERKEVALGNLRIQQVGATEASELPAADFLVRAQTDGWLELRPQVAAAEARAVALGSDGLLLIQPHTAVQVPGKLFEYLRMGRPIFAYVVPGSPVERILERAGVPWTCVYPEHSPEEIERRLLDFLAKLKGPPAAPSAWFDETFEASRQTETLERLIKTAGSLPGAREDP